MSLSHSAMGWSAVCDCGISWSYSPSGLSVLIKHIESTQYFKAICTVYNQIVLNSI